MNSSQWLDIAILAIALLAAVAGFAPAPASFARLFASPGPIHEPQPAGTDPWRTARALHAAGFRAGDVVLNTFGYHMTPGGWIMDSGARALGCAVIPMSAPSGSTASSTCKRSEVGLTFTCTLLPSLAGAW